MVSIRDHMRATGIVQDSRFMLIHWVDVVSVVTVLHLPLTTTVNNLLYTNITSRT